jgi:hypothetical protein
VIVEKYSTEGGLGAVLEEYVAFLRAETGNNRPALG